MPLWSRKRSSDEGLDPAAAVARVVERMRNDCTEARFQVLAAEADLRRLMDQTAKGAGRSEWSEQLSKHRQQVAHLRRDLGRLEGKVAEAEAQAHALAARASSSRARLSLSGFLTELETGDAVEVFDRLRDAVRDLEHEVDGFEAVEDLLSQADD